MPGPVTDERAHDLRRRYEGTFGAANFPVPVTALAEDLLGLAVEESGTIECSGILLPHEHRVILRADEGEARKRFTLAHELGHWVCQCLEGRVAPIYCRKPDVTPDPAARGLEREANVFAAELLMPEGAVRERWGDDPTLDALAGSFGVSGEAMQWRLYSFGLGDAPASSA